jgi:RNA polymerase sigma factor (sigma-70 family)
VTTTTRLTRREREVLTLVAEGMTNAEIGARLWISAGTVRRHLENAYSKLEVHTRTGAVRAAFG